MDWRAWVLQLTAVLILGVTVRMVLGGRSQGFARFLMAILLLSVIMTPVMALWTWATGDNLQLDSYFSAGQSQTESGWDYEAFYKSTFPSS
jgi:hypothetical protein